MVSDYHQIESRLKDMENYYNEQELILKRWGYKQEGEENVSTSSHLPCQSTCGQTLLWKKLDEMVYYVYISYWEKRWVNGYINFYKRDKSWDPWTA